MAFEANMLCSLRIEVGRGKKSMWGKMMKN
jgi:hypothetical protein